VQILEATLNKQLEQIDKLSALSEGKTAPEETKALRVQLAQARKLLNSRAEELKQLRAELAAQAGRGGDAERALEELFAIRNEREQLLAHLAEAERKLADASATDTRDVDELQARFELAVQEIRELKSKNEQLERQACSAEPRVDAGSFSWEQQKARLMRELEGFNDADQQQAADKLTVQGAIAITDQVVGEKDREIADLRLRLEQYDKLEAGAPPGPAAPDYELHREEAIRAEQEKLSALQAEWQAKLCEAEVEVSVQRAKLARERMEIEEQRRALEQQREELGPAASKPATGKTQTGRWLSRLGLKDDD